METTSQTEVLIIGAGPTGLSLAAQLTRYGIDFIIVDKKEGCTELSKALVVHARTLEIYDQIGLAEKAVFGGQRVEKLTMLNEGKVKARVDFSDLGPQMSPYPFPLIFEQSKNEHMLYGHLQHNGKEVGWQTQLVSLTQGEKSVSAVLRDASGTTRNIQSRYLVGCDGASSLTRHNLELKFEGGTDPRTFYVADVEMNFDSPADSLYACFGRDSFVILFPMQGKNHWRLVGNPPRDHEGAAEELVYSEIETEVKKLVDRPLSFSQVSWFSTYKVHTRHTENFRAGRCFLAGDAAHVHTPVGGQGMNTGIQDAYNLAWKLAMVLHGLSDEIILESYNEERLAVARQLLKSTDQMFDIGTAANWYLHFFRDHIMPGLIGFATHFEKARETVFRTVSQIGISYRDSSLSQHADDESSIKAGDRMPYFLVDGVGIYERLRTPQFHVLALTDSEEDGELKAEIESIGAGLVNFQTIALTPAITEIFGGTGPFLVLLRPDNYIGVISSLISADVVKGYFENVIGKAKA